MSRERKKFALRATYRPAKASLVSTVVAVRNEAGQHGYCYVNFDDSFIDFVGHKLPEGVSKGKEAVLSVVYYAATSVWLVKASYVDQSHTVLLWKTSEKPSWLNFHRYKEKSNGNSAKTPAFAR
jgi:hypothetical protein